ncbi:MAG: PilZ domain-containing protein [Candidatus Omnitrophota bacterium]|nr:PilZ domain-containing protein [Candidatus Omnitrophota bacterium]
MPLIIETVIVGVLIIALITLFIEEARMKKSKIPKGSVKEFWDGRERRKAIRIDTSFVIKYSVKKDPGKKLNGQAKDMSKSGMKFMINEKFAKGTLLLLEFELSSVEKTIIVEGKVVWAAGEFSERDETEKRIFYTGVQFVNIKSNDENRLVGYIEKIAKES